MQLCAFAESCDGRPTEDRFTAPSSGRRAATGKAKARHLKVRACSDHRWTRRPSEPATRRLLRSASNPSRYEVQVRCKSLPSWNEESGTSSRQPKGYPTPGDPPRRAHGPWRSSAGPLLRDSARASVSSFCSSSSQRMISCVTRLRRNALLNSTSSAAASAALSFGTLPWNRARSSSGVGQKVAFFRIGKQELGHASEVAVDENLIHAGFSRHGIDSDIAKPRR